MFSVGIVGCGAIAGVYAQALRASTRAVLVAACDTDAASAARFADANGVVAYADHRAMFAANALDGVIVCTPPVTHAAVTIDALEHGIDVICEKPFAVTMSDAQAMVRAAEAARKILTMGSKFRYVSDVANAKAMLLDGAIGTPVLFQNVFTSYVDMRSRWNAQASISGGGVLMDNGTHSVDIMRYFLGPVASVRAVEARRTQGLSVDETVRVMVRNPDGVIGDIDLSWSIQKTTPNYIEIYGTEGTIAVGWRGSQWLKRGATDWTTFGAGYDKVQAFRSQIDNFVGAVAGTEKLVIDTTDALASVEVVAATYHSMENEHWVDVASIPPAAFARV